MNVVIDRIVFLGLVVYLVERLLSRAREDQAAHRAQVQGLLQRIQAPEAAVIEHAQHNLAPDEPYPLTDEESVEAQRERELALERIEAMEREGIGL